MRRDVQVVTVFGDDPSGGNPAPVVLDATGMSDADMQAVARESGHESVFVLPAPDGSPADATFRFWVPAHEMEMCGHATVGAVWLMEHLGQVDRDELSISTLSGDVRARVRRHVDGTHDVAVSQPPGRIDVLTGDGVDEVLDVLGIDAGRLADRPVVNATTSRAKTLVPLDGVETLTTLSPDLDRVEQVCTDIDSTGLYPYAVVDAERQEFEARQFPRSSGYPEDPATGIAAAALAFGLLDAGLVEASERPITIHQGRAMGRPSTMTVRFMIDAGQPVGCWLGGGVRLDAEEAARA